VRLPNFVGPTYQSIAVKAAAEDAVNLFVESIESGDGVNDKVLLGTPGTKLFVTLPNAPVRGLWSGDGRLFAVGGSKLFEITWDGTTATTVLKGDVGDDAAHSPVDIIPNGQQLLVISAGNVYLHDGAAVSQPAFPGKSGTGNLTADGFLDWVSGADKFSADMQGQAITVGGVARTVFIVYNPQLIQLTANSVPALTGTAWSTISGNVTGGSGTFLDGYYIVNVPGSKQFNISAINDGRTWDALDFATKEGYPDNINRVIADHETLWVMGKETIELWRNTGNADFPLQRDPGGFIQRGLSAARSACRVAGGLAWLSADTAVPGSSTGSVSAWFAVGSQPQRISTHAAEQAWRNMTFTSDAVAYSYEDRGHQFWVINFPSGNQTWVYDFTTKLWHRRAYGSAMDRHKGGYHAACFGRHLIGDYSTGAVYEMSETIYDDAGTPIERLRTAPTVADQSENDLVFYHRFELVMRTGDVANPSVTLKWSNDGGTNWSNAHTITAGALNDTIKRVIWRRLGRSRDRVFSVRFNAAIPVRLIDAYIEVTKGKA
jgi:hypothetical protein